MSILEMEIRHAHLFCGLGGGAAGFNQARPDIGVARGRFRCIGGIDVDPGAVADFSRIAGVRGTVLDLFDRDQYRAFHGHEPPKGWREATTADIHAAYHHERPGVLVLSAPCKGFSGLMPETKSRTDKYVALNRLTLRGVMLTLEAYKDDPVEFYVFENVPRIQNRGRPLLNQITALFRAYGYAVVETTHDCGELGELAQSRKRFLLMARHIEKVPPFLYEPQKRPLQAVGSILGRMPLAGDVGIGGPMHRVPSLQWKTWVRLAFVEAGSDWRSLNRLAVEQGYLRDYLIVPSHHHGWLGVRDWNEPSGTVAGASRPGNGSYSIADPRASSGAAQYQQFGVLRMRDTSGAVIGVKSPGQGTFSIADPRCSHVKHNNCFRVVPLGHSVGTVTGGGHPSAGGQAVADPRCPAERHGNVYRVVGFDQASGTVTADFKPTGGGGVADPRPPRANDLFSKYPVTRWGDRTGTVIGGDDAGAYAVADPRATGVFAGAGKLAVTEYGRPAGTVIARSDTGHGAYAIADPRPATQRQEGDAYLTNGHYGVVPWEGTSGAVSAAAGHDNGRWSVADPRLPGHRENLVCVIRSLDGTWHRPFTTLELAAIQSLIDPEEKLELDGLSDQAWRERIGNAIPPKAARAIGEELGRTLLLARTGQTFALGSTPIWVRDVAVALSLPAREDLAE